MNVETELAVTRLYARQSHAIDGGDAEGWAATYLPDGTFESPTFQLTARGSAELAAFATSSQAAAADQGKRLRHHIDTLVIEPLDDARLRVDAYMLIIATTDAGSVIDRSLRIEDELAHTETGWLVASRRVIRD